MFTIQTLNKISSRGLDLLPAERFSVSDAAESPDAILVRSKVLHDMSFPESLKAIARAGAGVNNIPIDRCTQHGIVVFNTPGANANGVKELVLTGMLLSSRRVFQGVEWARSLRGKGDEIPALVEKEKSRFVGPEIKGKRLGVIGLGAIGVQVANDATALGMEVVGYDPFISVESAWGLSRSVKRASDLESLLAGADYITIHVPLDEHTRGMVSWGLLSKVKRGARFLNFARAELVNLPDMVRAIEEGIIECFVTDFPEESVLANDKIIALPHLGASTPEAEDNCAVMAAEQLKAFLETGNVKNSVNFPDCEMRMTTKTRVLIANRNIPNMVGQITTLLASQKINISEMINRHKGDYAYNIIDLESAIPADFVQRVMQIEGVIMARVIKVP
jgi:D-3-phosphoglycerate dehydrogenase / 2-oxoglutarate reductase